MSDEAGIVARASAISMRERFESLLKLGAGEMIRGVELSVQGAEYDHLSIAMLSIDSDGAQDGWDKRTIWRVPQPSTRCSCVHESGEHQISLDALSRRVAHCTVADCGCRYHAVRS